MKELPSPVTPSHCMPECVMQACLSMLFIRSPNQSRKYFEVQNSSMPHIQYHKNLFLSGVFPFLLSSVCIIAEIQPPEISGLSIIPVNLSVLNGEAGRLLLLAAAAAWFCLSPPLPCFINYNQLVVEEEINNAPPPLYK